jgi:hypothetical protein
MLPVVRLARDVASCSICLIDFVAGIKLDQQAAGEREDENALRLLGCGHVFHVSHCALR